MKNDKYSGKSRDEKLDMALEDRDKFLRIEDELGKFAKITGYNIINIDGCDLLMPGLFVEGDIDLEGISLPHELLSLDESKALGGALPHPHEIDVYHYQPNFSWINDTIHQYASHTHILLDDSKLVWDKDGWRTKGDWWDRFTLLDRDISELRCRINLEDLRVLPEHEMADHFKHGLGYRNVNIVSTVEGNIRSALKPYGFDADGFGWNLPCSDLHSPKPTKMGDLSFCVRYRQKVDSWKITFGVVIIHERRSADY